MEKNKHSGSFSRPPPLWRNNKLRTDVGCRDKISNFLIKEAKVNNTGQTVKTATTNEQSH